MTLADKLGRWLDESGISARELARRIGVSPPTVGRWLSGQRRPRQKDLMALARVTRMSVDYLVDDSLDEPALPEVTREERNLLDALRAAGISPAQALGVLLRAGAIVTTSSVAPAPSEPPEPEPAPAPAPAPPKRPGRRKPEGPA